MDALTAPFEPASFDVVYSRDTILHIEKKEELFKLCLVGLHSYKVSFIISSVLFINNYITNFSLTRGPHSLTLNRDRKYIIADFPFMVIVQFPFMVIV